MTLAGIKIYNNGRFLEFEPIKEMNSSMTKEQLINISLDNYNILTKQIDDMFKILSIYQDNKHDRN